VLAHKLGKKNPRTACVLNFKECHLNPQYFAFRAKNTIGNTRVLMVFA